MDGRLKGLRHLRLRALEVHDLALAKLPRNCSRDRADIEFLVKKGALDKDVLRRRFEIEMRPHWSSGSRSSSDLAPISPASSHRMPPVRLDEGGDRVLENDCLLDAGGRSAASSRGPGFSRTSTYPATHDAPDGQIHFHKRANGRFPSP